MKVDVRLFGHLGTGEECQADLSIYVVDPQEIQGEVENAALTAPWFIVAPGWPDVPDGAQIVVEKVERLDSKHKPKELPPMIKRIHDLFGGNIMQG